MRPKKILYGEANSLWLILAAVYVLRGPRRKGAFRADLQHEVAGPFASLIRWWGSCFRPTRARICRRGAPGCLGFIAALAIVAAQLLAHWVTDGLSMQSIHPGYLLPVVPGFFVASIGFLSIHVRDAAMAAFGIDAFLWLVEGTFVAVRLMTGAGLTAAAKIGLSACLAAPATANLPGCCHIQDLWGPPCLV